jgi:hypothetical protein
VMGVGILALGARAAQGLKPMRGAVRARRLDEVADRVHHRLELGVMTLLQLIDAGGQIALIGKDPSDADERSHCLDVDVGPFVTQHARRAWQRPARQRRTAGIVGRPSPFLTSQIVI